MPKPVKHLRFGEVVKDLIGFESSEPVMEVFESKVIEYMNDNYNIYVEVAYYGLSEYFQMPNDDLLRFVKKPRASISIEKLRLYTMANDYFSNIYYEIREPDENGIWKDYEGIAKTFRITTEMFRIKKEDLSDLLEDIKRDDPFDLKGKEEEKEKNTATLKPQEIQSTEETLFYNKTTGKFRFRGRESLSVSATSRHKARKMAEKLMTWWDKGEPCPQSEIVRDPTKKTSRPVYDNRSKISNQLKDVRVNMPQSSNDEYLPPEEPKHFEIVS
jgi:hypothetical protein